MPDFTIEVYFHCRSVEDYSTTVQGSKPYKVWVGWANWPGAAQYEWQCECPAFKFRKTCKHIEQAKKDPNYCGWQQMIDGDEPVRGTDGHHNCPKCGGQAIAMEYAV